jgi:hypothetical protein
MFKTAFAALFTLLMFMGSTAIADDCTVKKATGSYVALRPTTVSGSGAGILDQLRLNSDGTAYWYQSTSFDLLVSQGSFIPQIGSWQCNADGTLLVTTIGVTYHSTGTDIAKDSNERFTQKLSVINDDTLQVIIRVFKDFPLTTDPLDPAAVPSSTRTGTTPFQFKRVKPVPSDIP